MKKTVRVDGLMVLTGAAIVGGYLLYRNAAAIGDKVNPTSTNNIVYQGVNAVGDILNDGGDNDNFSLGAWLWEITHPEQVKAEQELFQ
ncbi:hypothetical protein [Microbulbifer taiwanensis]|uniref:Uncharacterized protein n=2 Tax=Microbulbifer taiwanensis TaxID=986746 RepID=A0ABW1YTV3_9GAMM